MKITYDKIADAAYIYLKKSKIAKTVCLADRLIADLDKNGKIVGIELLDASSQIGGKRPSEIIIKIPAFS
ncbi:hypothetical protein A3A95_03285 [Candidatus Nomurabacteria bacterium RIFCSPLOWO2_01_FULL_39_18]|uniref:DUF2283 domain-containing protein n=1 Tax=Candidatus Nomurabacteria bacterium RIFCSPHIGHO2_01_FULL_40_24b TaxID=1801739 RepID=A0A1F6V6Q8_9BACT|nr:MAG: hypothetical protein A2647_05120 [Candidatus Nomurabacteria bacterium RIFCSPHIGHO2_01_FULL_40_24b]OGI89110.1 MAG: hypothetical protein A3A95_03285 [Candidatus Nomurabacteria bacterium RIFCSPLOWO2_01_FULL_39_18]